MANCNTCEAEVALDDIFCGSCGSRLSCETVALKYYFKQGYEYDAIVDFLSKFHGISMSLRTLKNRLKVLGLNRKSTEFNEQELRERIMQEIDGPGSMSGYRAMWHTLRREGYMVPRKKVEELLKELDPEGCQTRRAKRLKRRVYVNPGPNYCWHMDGYDKLKPYGFPIHGCIDGFSRKMLWLKLSRSNNNPQVILKFFLDTVDECGGCPTKLRTDCGTENGLAAAAQCYFTENEQAHIYGTSPHNQRIEGWWSYYRKGRSTWWMNFFKDLMEREVFTTGNDLEMECLWFCFSTLIQQDLDHVKDHWNTHYIRRSRHETIAGRPDELFHLPERHNAQDFVQAVNDEQRQEVLESYVGTQEDETQEDETQEDETQEDETQEDETQEDETQEDETQEDETQEDETQEDETQEDETQEDETQEDETQKDENEHRDYFEYVMSNCGFSHAQDWKEGLELYHNLKNHANGH